MKLHFTCQSTFVGGSFCCSPISAEWRETTVRTPLSQLPVGPHHGPEVRRFAVLKRLPFCDGYVANCDFRSLIPLLAEYLLERYANKAGKKINTVDGWTLEMLQNYDWPGNVRELQNVIERAVILCETPVLSPWTRPGSGARHPHELTKRFP
jgi:hypothetical protein